MQRALQVPTPIFSDLPPRPYPVVLLPFPRRLTLHQPQHGPKHQTQEIQGEIIKVNIHDWLNKLQIRRYGSVETALPGEPHGPNNPFVPVWGPRVRAENEKRAAEQSAKAAAAAAQSNASPPAHGSGRLEGDELPRYLQDPASDSRPWIAPTIPEPSAGPATSSNVTLDEPRSPGGDRGRESGAGNPKRRRGLSARQRRLRLARPPVA